MFEAVDLYCERTSPEFWAEPVNALTNISFLISAAAVWQLATRLGLATPKARWLAVLIGIIGVGSFLFHTFANNLTRFLDVAPILLFQAVYTWIYCRDRVQMGRFAAGAVVGLFLIGAMAGRQFPQILNGSLIYGAVLVTMAGLAAFHFISRQRERWVLIAGVLVFLLSLTCRAVDNLICPHVPLGIHFMWHVCNGLVAYLFVRGFLISGKYWIQRAVS